MMTSSYLRSESADITAEALKESMLKQHCGSSSLILQAERPSADLQRTQEAPLTFDLTSDLPILRPRNKPSVEYKYGPSTDLLSPSVCWDQMMKAVQAAALFLMMMMMMMMMGSVSAFLLPPSFNDSRHADQVSPHLLNNSDSTRFESRQNNSLDDIPGRVASNTMNGSRSSPPIFPVRRCILPTCLTANLGSSLQGGDQKAGGATTDPLGIGKK